MLPVSDFQDAHFDMFLTTINRTKSASNCKCRFSFAVWMGCVWGGEHDSVGDWYLPLSFLCLSVCRAPSSRRSFSSSFHLPEELNPRRLLRWHFIYQSGLWTTERPMATSLSSHRHGSRMRPAVRPTSCLPICNCPQSHFLSDKQGPLLVKLISFTSFPHSAASHRFSWMWQFFFFLSFFTVKTFRLIWNFLRHSSRGGGSTQILYLREKVAIRQCENTLEVL